MKRRIIAFILIAVMLVSFASCGGNMPYNENMPYNGDIVFHDIKVYIPQSFIRDSTKSSDEAWVFEKGFYKEFIIIKRDAVSEDASAELDSYAEYLAEQGITAERIAFQGREAVMSESAQSYELIFEYNSYFYAISLRGGSKDDFNTLVNTVGIENNIEK